MFSREQVRRAPCRMALAAIVTVVLGACSATNAPTRRPDRARRGPLASTSTKTSRPAENVAFDYERIRATTDLRSLGHVTTVITARQRDPRAARAIHRIGATAYRYVQAYWLPTRPDRDGLDLSRHLDWGFCRTGHRLVRGHRPGDPEPLVLLDANERGIHTWYARLFARLKAQGWDGVFLDRGYAALAGVEGGHTSIWNQVSTCTISPFVPGATFADAYLGIAAEVHRAGLKLIMNYGVSPFDPATPLRPDPRDPACVDQTAPTCRHLDDAWSVVDQFVDEAVTHRRDDEWQRDFTANSRNETDPAHGGRTIGLITDALLQGKRSRHAIVYAWSRAKLFAIPIAVGTGSGGCPTTDHGTVCNRDFAAPDLASTSFGPPVDPAPQASDCEPGSPIHCLWTRRYRNGFVVVNAQNRPAHLAVDVGPKCRRVVDLAPRPARALGCRTRVELDVAAWSGRPLQFR